MDMDSPEATNISAPGSDPSPPIKESPFSSYVNTLSPFQYSNLEHGLQAYEDLSFPSPQPVFTSPHISLPRKDTARSFLSLPLVTSESVVQLSSRIHEGDGNPSSKDENSGDSSSFVDTLLEDPLDNFDKASCKFSSQAKEMTQIVHEICTNANVNTMESSKNDFAYLNSATSASALVDESIDDAVGRSDPSNLNSEVIVVLQRPLIDSNSTLELNDQTCEYHTQKTSDHKTTEQFTSSDVEKVFSGTEAYFPIEPSLTDGETKSVDAVEITNKISLDGQPVSIINNNPTDSIHSLLAPTTGEKAEVDMVDQDLNTTTKLTGVRSQGFSQVSDELHSTPQSFELIQDFQDVIKDPDVSQDKIIPSADNQIPYDEDIAQLQRGMRKRLQFEAIKNTACQEPNQNFTYDLSGVEPSDVAAHMLTSNASHAEPFETCGMKQGSHSDTQSFMPDLMVKPVGSSSLLDPRPSRIGLHLNSIGSIGMVAQLMGKDSCLEESSFLGSNDQLSQGSDMESVSTGLVGQHTVALTANVLNPFLECASEDTGANDIENHVLELPTSSHQTPQYAKTVQFSMQSKLAEQYITPRNLKRPLSKDDDKFDNSSQSSSRKKRRKPSEIEGQKRCSCKRSKCLKLYCDCFAAGIFCTEVCGCQQCTNKPENEDAIHEAKHQIESRNPLAFAPKVVLCVSDPLKDSEETMGATPNSARHKRGCNCKKSLCLKKYCECYQTGVGCSFGCRCEGCKNPFGRKEGCTEIIEIEHKRNEEKLDGNPSTKTKGKNPRSMVDSRLSSLTPSVQVTGFSSGVDAAKCLVLPRYLTSPETSGSALVCYERSPGSPMNLISKGSSENAGEDSILAASYDPDSENDLKVDIFSPGWNGFPDICTFSPLEKNSPSNTREPKVLQTRLVRANSLSLHRHGSPVTPLHEFGRSKVPPESDSDSRLNKETIDYTPEILKDSCLPTQAVKASSPKQKRVSPPKRLLHRLRSSSSSGRSGRKFILQSVPSFPPLTPHSNNNRGSGGT
ncbi:uncharacterized protein LOC121991713 [Zingiber officinale]|uniref:uncharacterized protein LOC121991713 n=1 Tax=Zingiber officinale TaxID=94328 RepID=UPI001C4C917A|nr:uncharacterized protein LOC121991713 [Zingiber officinale]